MDAAFEGQGLGSTLVGEVIRLFADVGPRIGLPHLILVPADQDYERLVAFHGSLGFETYKDGETMLLPLESAIDAVQKMEAEQASLPAMRVGESEDGPLG